MSLLFIGSIWDVKTNLSQKYSKNMLPHTQKDEVYLKDGYLTSIIR